MSNAPSNPGTYPETIEILAQKTTGTGTDGFGHRQTTWRKIGMAAARRWQISNSERNSAPTEYQSTAVRLLVRATLVHSGHQVRWAGTTYKVTASETRDRWDSLITMEPI